MARNALTFCIFLCLFAGCWLAVAGNQSKSSPDKPVRLYAATYTDNEMTENIQHFDFYPTDPFGLGLSWDYDDPLWTYTVNWSDGSTGNAVEHMHDTGSCDYGNWNDAYIASTTAWPVGSWPDIPPGVVTKHDGDTDYAPSPVILEYCETKVPLADHTSSYLMPTSPPYLWTIKQTANRHAQATMKLQTGGRALSQRQNLFCLSGAATQIIGVKDPLPWSANGPFVKNLPVPPQNIMIDGMSLGSDGKQWRLYADNDTRDVTPLVKGMDYYTFTMDQQKYLSHFKAYAEQPDPGGPRWVIATLPGLAGHSWWGLDNDAPMEAYIALSSQMGFDLDITQYLSQAAGYFPAVQLNPLMLFSAVPGKLKCPEGGGTRVDACQSSEIGFDDLIVGLTFIKTIQNNPGWYQLYRVAFPWVTPANNCTTKTVEAGKNVHVTLPDDWNPQNFGIDLNTMPNPCN